ncbi:hypothetical protein DIZ81_06895 [Legionella taurinensis]|uniref:WipA-like phosphatase domain-containing protein n=1 Tax=Legionella taurinensis TaxID=70611 RepID=A0A3A5L354_9GAMM|nr:hypothetical protein [Legionella taurinensis]MDX1837201.1 hypothetical protein [Legionella taurinensis]PUT40324.1 hypothetical protein DB744_06895 [Legionella taurinensis]PUT41559.1 hypothetical protein DB746_09405 [Legionella taurinensis]PUT44424.1 hypothetical protein DB743_08620 [Legionella taurinensis]PUT48386.1 hypothetical protein DB745_05295 [Legionella taurinensis]
MTHTVVKEKDVNLEEYPFSSEADEKERIKEDISLTIGDLHGNSLKLFWILVKQNALKLNPIDGRTPKQLYERFVAIYKTPADQLTKADLEEFNRILDGASLNRLAMLRLIGDELADRGQNDYFTLKILKRLGDAGVRTEILLSNHSAEFLDNHHRGSLKKPEDLLGDENARSMHNLGTLLERGLVDSEEITSIVKDHYLPALKAISYSIDNTVQPPRLTLYTHAPVGIETIRSLADLYGIPYDDSSIDRLCRTIDQINERVHQDLSEHSVHDHHRGFLEEWTMGLGSIAIPHDLPLLRLMWNRGDVDKQMAEKPGEQQSLYGIELPMQQNGYQLALVHGHDGPSKKIFSDDKEVTDETSYLPNMYNTDNDLGKRELTGDFHLVASKDTPAPLALRQVPVQMHAVLYRLDEGLRTPPVFTAREWHQRFIDAQLAEFARIDNNQGMSSAIARSKESLINFMSIYQVPYKKGEDIVDFSMRVAESNRGYASRIETFKSQSIQEDKTIASDNLARAALKDIKQFIETSDWQVGKWGSRTKIEVNGKMKPIPGHLYEIYKKCSEAENGGNPTQLMQSIHGIAEKALQPKFKLFESYRERYQSTMEVYKVIERDTRNLLKP